MADESQATLTAAPPVETAAPVAAPQPAAQPASTEAAQSPVKISPDEFRQRLASGELQKTIRDSGKQPNEWIRENVTVDTMFSQPSQPEEKAEQQQKETPSEPKPEDKEGEPKRGPGRPPKEKPKTVDWFIQALQEKGFKYDTPEKALDGYINKEQAVTTYRTEARALQEKLQAEQSQRERLSSEYQSLQKRLKELEEKANKQPEPLPQKVELPPAPKLDFDSYEGDDEKAQKIANYQTEVQRREQALQATFDSRVKQLENAFRSEMSKMNNNVNSLMSEYRKAQEAQKREDAQRRQKEMRDNAFMSAKELMDKVPKYKLSQDLDKVYEKYNGILADVQYLQRQNPAYNGRDLIAEYITGNPAIVSEFDRRQIGIDDDVKTYMTMAQLEQDCYIQQKDGSMMLNPALCTNGRPDLVKALRLREEDSGIRAQELADAKVQGYDSAADVMQRVAGGAKTLSAADSAATPPSQPNYTADQVIEKMREIRTGNYTPDQRRKMTAELMPYMAKLQGVQVS